MTGAADCPLCAGTSHRLVTTIPYDEIWKGLREDWGARLPESLVRSYTPEPAARLTACDRCDLQYFDPHNAGRADFYEALDAGGYYEPDRWEFGAVAEAIEPEADVVDLGCGRGAFLLGLGDRPGRRAGLDHNPPAVAALKAAGVEASTDPPATFADANPESFDVACSFHVIEHLARVHELVDAARRSVRRGGTIFLSAPNRDRLTLTRLEPLDCPPHHVSRWGVDQLGFVADHHGLRLRSVRSEPIAPRTRVHLAGQNLRRLVLRERRWGTSPVGAGDLLRRSRLGFAILAEYERP